MKLSLNWLKEFIDFDLEPEQLAHKLTHAGLEVESCQRLGVIPESVKVVQIEKIDKHPQADRLSLCDVNLGHEVKKIVCGAKNMKVGDKVPLAQVGTILPDGKKIEKSKIRGIESEGMLCSEVELGLFEESSGLMILPPSLKNGASLASQMKLEDVVFEINVTPNRADCLSVFGLAREVSALLGLELKKPVLKTLVGKFSVSDYLKLEVQSKDLCPRYTARMIQGVQVAPSPFEIRLKLHRMGIRSINNIVDATNYVMLELGQPLHAFDYSEIQGGKLLLRQAQSGEKVKTLDGVERSLESNDLLIADSKQGLAIAGIMGCESSGITDHTKTLVLEAAYFQPKNVRKTSRRLGLQSESSYRFERGVDLEAVALASNRLASLILEWAGGEISSDMLDTLTDPLPPKKINLRYQRIKQILGFEWELAAIEKTLQAIHLKPRLIQNDIWECSVPSYRHDLQREVDLIEEVARLQGYDQIPSTLPQTLLHVAQDYEESDLETKLRYLLSGEGFLESIHYSFGSLDEFQKCGYKKDDLIVLQNPISEDLAFMRPALLPSVLSCLRYNVARQNQDLKIFELRKIYLKTAAAYQEKKSLALAFSGQRMSKSWNQVSTPVDFYDLKGLLENIWENYKLPSYELKLSSNACYHPGASASLWVQNQKVADFGVIHPQIAENFDLKIPVVAGEFDLDCLISLKTKSVSFFENSKFPWVDRDLTVVVSKNVESREVEESILSLNVNWLKQVRCVDVYQGEPIEAGKKALTYSLIYLDPEKTLTDQEVNSVHQQVMDYLKKNYQ